MAVKFLNGIDVDGSMNIVASDVPNLDASKITSGTFSVDRIPNLSGTYQPAGDYLTLETAGTTFQPIGNYLTSVPSEYLTQTEGDARYLKLTGGTLTGTLTLSAVNPRIDFNGTSDSGVDMAIVATPEGLNFIEPEQQDKVHFQILDDTGVNSPFGYQWNGQSLDSRYASASHNHNTLYDSIGSADAVNLRIDQEVFPAISSITLASLGYTGATNANYITNNNQLTNGAGYITSYTETDTLDSVVSRNGSTGNNVNLSSSANRFNGHHYFDPYDGSGNHYPHYVSGSGGAVVNTRVYRNATQWRLFVLNGKNGSISWDGNELATQSYVTTQINNVIDSAPGALNTLNELAAALGDDANFSTTVANSIGAINTRIDTEVLPSIPTNNNQLTNGAGYITDGNTGWNNSYGFITNSISTGITINGSLSRGTYTSASQYHTGADNIVLKGNSSGISGLFFESEKNGTNINHPSDFGFIQYHAYGTSTSGESNELIIGVSNDADDHVVLNAPNVNGLKFRVGSSETEYNVYHSGNLSLATLGYTGATNANYITNNNQLTNGAGYITSADGGNADTVDGKHASTTRNSANTIPVRDGNGYLNLGWINTTSGNTTSTLTDIYVNTNDGYIRKATPAHFRSQITNGHYDTIGSAAAVDTRITEDIVPAIGAAQTTADNAATAAADALFDANKALQEVANIPTNNNQLTNGAGYLTATNDRVYITDSRGSARAPSYYNDRYAQWDFQNSADTGVGGDSWHGILTVSKWSSWNASHRQEQLIFSGDHLWRRTASSDSVWGDNKKIWDSGNLDAFVSASVSNDTITFTKANGGTVAVTTSDANTNTWRGIHDTPVDGATTTSISSNWAFDNVKTPVPTNAKFTDTNTQLTDAQVRSKFSGGTNVSISSTGVISATDTNTQLTDAQVRSKFSAGTNVAISATGVISSTDTNTWRPIDSTPTNGATGDSISSDWAYDNVRNFSSGGNSLAGSFTASGDITAFSDARVKENVETIHSALEKVTSMRGVTYNKIGDEKSSMGVIAQEIQEVAPEVVRENEDGMLSVAYGNITAVLIEAIKEQQKQIEELKSRLDGVTK